MNDGRKPQYTLGFVGWHGSGKTTLIRKMLLGRYISDPLTIDPNDAKLEHLCRKAVRQLVSPHPTTNYDPFYRVTDHVYWNENLIFNLFDMMPSRTMARKSWIKGASFCDGIVCMLDISMFTVSNRQQVAEEVIGNLLQAIFATSSVVQDLIIVINKMDLIDNKSVELFDFVRIYIEKSFKNMITFRKTSLKIIPMSLLCETNIVRSFQNAPLDQYDTFLSCLRELKPYPYDPTGPFRMIHLKTFSMYGLGRICIGKVISGVVDADEEFEICQSTLRKTFKCTSQGQSLMSFNEDKQKSIAGELLGCNLFRGWALINYSDYYGPMTFFNRSQTTCKPCTSYFTVKLTGPFCNMKSSDDLKILFFGFLAHVDLISKSKPLYKQCIYAIFKFKDNGPAFTLEEFKNVPEMSRVTLYQNRIIGYGIVTDIKKEKYYSICYTFLYSRLLDSHFHDISFQFQQFNNMK